MYYLSLSEKSQSCIYTGKRSKEANGEKGDKLIKSIIEKTEEDESTTLDRKDKVTVPK